MLNQSVSMESLMSYNSDTKRASSNPKVNNNSSVFLDILSGRQQFSSKLESQSVDVIKKSEFNSEFNQGDGFNNYNNYDQQSYSIDNFVKPKNYQSGGRKEEKKQIGLKSGQEREVSKLDGRKKADTVKLEDKRVQLAEKLEKLEEEVERLSNKKDSDKLQKKDLNKLKALLSSLFQLLNVKLDEKPVSVGVNSEAISLKKELQKLLNLVDKKDVNGKISRESLQKVDQIDNLKGFLDKVKSLLKDQGKLNDKKPSQKNGLSSNLSSKSLKSKSTEEQVMAKIDVVNQSKNDFRKLATKPVFQNGQQKNLRSKAVQSSSDSQPVSVSNQKIESSSNLSSGAEQFMSFDDKSSEMKGMQAFKQKTGVKNPKKIFNQIVKHAKVTMKSGMKEMKIQMNPKILGKIGIKLSLKDGQMTARLDVANSALRSLLKDNLSVLESQLRDSGINLVSLDLASHNGSQSNFSEMMNQDEQQKNRASLKTGSGIGIAEDIKLDIGIKHRQTEIGKVDLVA